MIFVCCWKGWEGNFGFSVLLYYSSPLTSFSLILVAAHPQVRRKLEDVSQKLDILYDKLRKQVLSPATLQGLHTILQHVWQYDYQSCMQVISGLIAGGSFAEMSDFMPGVKVLLQVAQQQVESTERR